MKIHIIILFVVFAIFILTFINHINYKTNEHFESNIPSQNNFVKITTPKEPVVQPIYVDASKKGIYSESINLLGDPLFSDVILYNNDENPYVAGEESGLEKCLDNCDGNCVEYGVTGITYCFPRQ